MKKYLFFILSLLFLPAAALCVGPSFEIYSGGGTSWPTVYNITVSPVQNGKVTIGANAFDVSGIYSMVAIIKNISNVEIAREVMYDDGAHEDDGSADGRYATLTDVSSYPVGTYYVYILATDNLGNSAIYAAEDHINLSAKQTIITNVTINPETVTVGGNISFSATLKYYDGTNLGTVEQIDFYIDQISSSNFVGRAYTNSLTGITDVYNYLLASSVQPGEHVLIANYTGDLKNAASYGQQQFTVFRDEAAISTEITPFIIGPPSIGAGQTAALYATLIFSSNKNEIPDKEILFIDNTDGEVIGTATTDASGMASIHYTLAPTASQGSHIISAIHYADADTGSSYNSAALNVLEGTRVDPFAALPSTAAPGANVTLSATLKTLGGNPLIGQRIIFTNNATGDNIGSAFTNLSGVATVPLTAPATIGTHDYLATYSGDLTKSGSVAMAHLTVMQGTYMENVSVTPNSASAGDVVSFSALLKYSNGSVAASKTINFYLDSVSTSNLLVSKTTNTSGVASVNYTILSSTAAGSHNIIASYDGTSTVLGCTATVSLNIVGRQTIITLTTTPTEVRPQQSISIKANLKYSGSSTVISGATISFSEVTGDPVDLGTAQTNGSGNASVSFTVPSTASEGTHTVKATYAGSGSILPTETVVTYTVAKIGTQISSYAPAAGTNVTAGTSVTVSAVLVNSSGNAVYNKPIVFTDTRTGVVLGTINTNSSGYARVTYSVPSNALMGTHNISISFEGDSSYSGCSAVTSINVKNTTLTFSISPASASVNSNVTLRATLKDASGGGIYNKTITFRDTTANITVTQTTGSGGVASKTYTIPSSSAIGTHNWTASFAGDSTYSSISASATLDVQSPPTCSFTEFYVSPSVTTAGPITPFIFSARLMSSTGSAISGATINFMNYGVNPPTTLRTATTTSSGYAGTDNSNYFFTIGTYTLKAYFAGNSSYQSCVSAPITLTINTASVDPRIEHFSLTPLYPDNPNTPINASATLIDFHTKRPMAGQFINFTENSSGAYLGGGYTDSNGTVSDYINAHGSNWICVDATYDDETYGSDVASACVYIEQDNYNKYDGYYPAH